MSTQLPTPPRPALRSTETGDPAIASFGTKIQVRTSAAGVVPETFVTLAGVRDIDGPGRSVSELETTSHSTDIPWRTYVPGLGDPGTLSFECYFNPSDPSHSANSPYGLEHLFESKIITKFRVINTDAARRTREFFGFVTELGESYPVDGINTRNVTIRISGLLADVVPDVTVTPTSASPTAAGGAATLSVTVISSGGGGWFPVPTESWITIQSPTSAQTASGTVNYTVAAQAPGAPARTAKILIGGVTVDVSQAAGA